MARRERPTVKGRDPAYSHTFLTDRPPLPNGMPPTVRIPGANDQPAAGAPSQVGEDAAAPPSSEPQAPEAIKAEAATAPDPAREKPRAAKEAPPPRAKPAKRAKAKPEPAAPTPQASPEPEPAADAPARETRRVTIKAAITSAHVEAMKPLVASGLAQRDVLAVAGRRAMKRFHPVAEFVPLPEGDRMALAQGYVTSKLIPAELLDGLRKVHDPLRLKSDAAMVRGQFEVLFWSVLEEVIEELHRQHVG